MKPPKRPRSEGVYQDGYFFIKMPDGKYVREHRHIMEQHLGRKLEKHEHVHHINELRWDNRIENLQVLSCSEHIRIHRPGMKRKIKPPVECKNCKKIRKHFALGMCEPCYGTQLNRKRRAIKPESYRAINARAYAKKDKIERARKRREKYKKLIESGVPRSTARNRI